MEKFLHAIISTIGGFFSWLLGGWSLLLTTLFMLNIFDYSTGMAANWGGISSKVGFKGLIKKGVMWMWIGIANLIYMILLEQGYSVGQVIPDAVTIGWIINEITSIAENSVKLGIKVPEPIKKGLALFNNKK